MEEKREHRTGYESPSWWYDIRGFFILKLAYRGSLWKQVSFFKKNMESNRGGAHLEAAIGSGTLFSMVLFALGHRRRAVKEIVGFDYADQMLQGALRRFGKDARIRLLAADVHKLPFADGSFQTANVANAIHCFSRIEEALSEIFRVLQPGGLLATNVLLNPRGLRVQRWMANRINRWGQKKGILYRTYEAEEFLTLVKQAGYLVVVDEIQGNGLFLVLKRPTS